MTDTFKQFVPLDDVFLLTEHTVLTDFAAAAKKPPANQFVSPALLRMIASPKEKPSAGGFGQF